MIEYTDMKHSLSQIYHRHNVDTGALILRVVIGIVFVYAGWFKITHLAAVTSSFVGMGFLPWHAGLVGWVELIGGLALILGILVKPANIALGVVMAVVVFGLPAESNSFLFGHDYQFVLLTALVSLYFIGPGRYTIRALKKGLS